MSDEEGEGDQYPTYDEVFEEHLAKKKQQRDMKKMVPMEVHSVPQKKIDEDEEQKKEQETVYRSLAPLYCICNHRKREHVMGVANCQHQGTRMFKGSLQTFECECKEFVSIKDQAEITF